MRTEKGEFNLFSAIDVSRDGNELWDIVISSEWAEANKKDSLKYFFSKLNKSLELDDLLKISRVIILKRENEFIRELKKYFNSHQNHSELINISINNIFVNKAYLLS